MSHTEAPEHVHGTRHGYIYYGCRCSPCAAANREYMRAYFFRRDLGTVKHGTREGYNRGCRCTPCRRANTVYMRNRRAKAPSALPVDRPAVAVQPSAAIDPPPAKILQDAGWVELKKTSLLKQRIRFWKQPDPRYSYARVRQEDALAIQRGEIRIEDKVPPLCAA